MGLFGDSARGQRMTDPVPGRALVVDVNDWLLETRKPYTLRATLVVEATGVPKTTVEHAETVDASRGTHLDKWPEQGVTIPVIVDRADPTRVQIEWDVMVGKADRLRASAQEQSAERKQALLAEAYGTQATPAAQAAPQQGESQPGADDERTCPSCYASVPAGLMFCRVCGGLMH